MHLYYKQQQQQKSLSFRIRCFHNYLPELISLLYCCLQTSHFVLLTKEQSLREVKQLASNHIAIILERTSVPQVPDSTAHTISRWQCGILPGLTMSNWGADD